MAPSDTFILRTPLASYFMDNADRFVFLPPAVDLQTFRPSETEGQRLRESYGLKDQTILFVGVLDESHWFKGLENLLYALRDVLPQADTHLIVVGDGERKSFYEGLARRLGIDHRVTFAGKVATSDLPKFYNASSCLVMPSVSDTESFGIVLAEAMACGVPVVASDVGGLPETIGNAGLLIPPRDIGALVRALKILLTDSRLRAELSARCLQRARTRYSWREVAHEHERLYLRLLTNTLRSQA
jgi:glycosyltransferase involved in cell wall biosynthesis